MMRRSGHITHILLAGVAMALGCTSAPAATAQRAETVHPPVGESARLQYLDKYARRHVTTLRHRAERTEGGQLRVKLLFRNEYKRDAWVTVKCVFLDRDGFEVEATNNEAILLPSKRDTSYLVTSLGSAVADYTVHIDNWAYSRDATMPAAR